MDVGGPRSDPGPAPPEAATTAGATYVLNIYPQTLDEVGVLAAFHRLEMIGAL